MHLTKAELAKLINDNVSGYRNCKGSEHLAELIIEAEKEAHRDSWIRVLETMKGFGRDEGH